MKRTKELFMEKELEKDYCHWCNRKELIANMTAYYPHWPEMEHVEYRCDHCIEKEAQYFGI